MENKTLAEASTGKAQAFVDFWNKLPDDSKQKVVKVFWDLAKEVKDSEAVRELFSKVLNLKSVKEALSNEAFTEEDKDTIIRKSRRVDATNEKLIRKYLDVADNLLEFMMKALDLCPPLVGALWDILELGPLDELLLGGGAAAADGPAPVGDVVGIVLVLVQTVLSFVPDKLIISTLASAGIFIDKALSMALKNLLLYNIIPEPKEAKELENAFKGEKPAELTEGFAAEFKLYETL